MEKRFRNCSGPQVRDLRIAASLTQEELAAKLQLAGLHSVDRVTVAKIESRIRSVFDYELAVIAKVLGTDQASLMPTPEQLKSELDSLIEGQR
jgi:transcriptional regulator with XRE-family HTH domain